MFLEPIVNNTRDNSSSVQVAFSISSGDMIIHNGCVDKPILQMPINQWIKLRDLLIDQSINKLVTSIPCTCNRQ